MMIYAIHMGLLYFLLYSVSGIKRNTSVAVSRSCRFSAHILLTYTQNVPFYSGYTVYNLVTHLILKRSLISYLCGS